MASSDQRRRRRLLRGIDRLQSAPETARPVANAPPDPWPLFDAERARALREELRLPVPVPDVPILPWSAPSRAIPLADLEAVTAAFQEYRYSRPYAPRIAEVICGRCGTHFRGRARNGLYILHACDWFRAEAERAGPDGPPILVESWEEVPELGEAAWFWSGTGGAA